VDEGGASRDDLGYLLAKASQRWNELLAEAFRDAGEGAVRPAFGSVLLPLWEEDGLRMSELAGRASLSKQAMTTLVAAVERAGLVKRQQDPADRRATRVLLTRRGRDLRPVAEGVLRDLNERAARSLTEAERRTLRRTLRKVMEL
jgi:DNA-binding MarR family transcriptional regulator